MKTFRACRHQHRNLKTIVFFVALGLAAMPARSVSADDGSAAKSDSASKAADKASAADSAKPSTARGENLGQRKQGDVGENEQLSFRQSKVAAEMTELEERMYRLSEALKRLEPENSSRLMSGVKYARTELIQHEMQDIQQILNKSNYKLAAGQEKELLAKLARLEQMLLSADLDLQMQLQKLRALREILHRLDLAIKEEGAEQKQSAASTERDKQLQNLPALREKLAELIRQQTAHVLAASRLSGDTPEENQPANAGKTIPDTSNNISDSPSSAEKLLTDQRQTRDDTKSLEERLAELSEAREHMEHAIVPLEQRSVREAVPHQKSALESLKKLAAMLDARQKELNDALSQERFNGMRRQQEQNRGSTDKISDMVRELGDSGAGAAGELARAGGNMSTAESRLGNRQPEPAGQEQSEALAALKYAREQLAQEEQQLLNKIRAEVKKRVLEGITEMLERQIAVRESTERLSPRLKLGSRQVLTAVVGLSKAEEQIMQVGDSLLGLVEETEFGIALPAALRSVIDEMDEVKQSLAAADASSEVVQAELQIEADLKELLDCMKRLPSTASSSPSQSGNMEARERELNRLVAELKMIRMLQVRVNRDTLHTDEKRAAELERMSTETKQKIEAIHDRQQDVHDVTDKLNTQRGNELR